MNKGQKIRSIDDKLLKYVEDNKLTREDIADDETVRWTLTTPLYNIGEHVYNLTADFKKAHSEIPWSKISGLRHRLVHDYDDTNWDIVNDIIFKVIPEFKNQIDKL